VSQGAVEAGAQEAAPGGAPTAEPPPSAGAPWSLLQLRAAGPHFAGLHQRRALHRLRRGWAHLPGVQAASKPVVGEFGRGWLVVGAGGCGCGAGSSSSAAGAAATRDRSAGALMEQGCA
jgi:hypothetical protein